METLVATRADVYAAIDQERAYQDVKWNEGTTRSGGRHTPTEWLVYIEDYVDEAKRYATRNPEPRATEFVLHTLRKIAAMAVHAMEQSGVRTRELEGGRAVGAVTA